MAEYIELEAFIEWLKRIPLIDLSDGRGLCRIIMEDDFKKTIKEMPKGIVEDVAPIRHGRWDNIPNTYMCVAGKDGSYHGCATSCSVCHEINPNAYKTNYCPNCGTRMDLEIVHPG